MLTAQSLTARGDSSIGFGDNSVQPVLGIAGARARAVDFLSVTSSGRFNVTEVKESTGDAGADIAHGVTPIKNTLRVLQAKVPDAKIGRLAIVLPRGGEITGHDEIAGDQLIIPTYHEGRTVRKVLRIDGKVVHIRRIP
ncbi:MAG: hypothetical protein MI924_00120 [Chloroflexales bacterium]|nr:hypothetical protein [Chloroflexales bacterium]